MSGDSPGAGSLRTGSLRLRTIMAVLLMLVILLSAVGVTIELVLGDRLRAQIEERLADRASAAASLIGTVDSNVLAQRLSVQGLSVLIRTPDGNSVAAGPSASQLRRGPGGIDDLKGKSPRGKPATVRAEPTSTSLAAGATVTIASSTISADEQIITLDSRLSDGSILTLAADASSVTETLSQLRLVMMAAGGAFLVIAGGGLTFVVRTTLRPLDRMTEVARSITAGDRGRRLNPERRRTEIGRVALAFDEMLDTVEGAERTALDAEITVRAFVSDAAHELRTPVAGMLAAAETMVRNPGTAEESERLASHIAREAGRASRLIDDMLMMARVDRGLELDWRSVDLVALIRADAERHALRHPHLVILLDLPEKSVVVVGDADRLSQVVNNLVDNAAHATAGVGRVVIALHDDVSEVRLGVTDSGPGVPRADRERIFERFVRLDLSRSAGLDGASPPDDHAGDPDAIGPPRAERSRSSHTGAGLGLPIARGIALAHAGDLCYDGSAGVSAFLLTLPAGRLPALG